MLVKIGSTDYKVYWRYDEFNNTACRILDITDESKKDNQIYQGMAFLSEKDNFNRDIGRKVSLSKALQKLYPGSGEEVRDPKTKKLLYRKRTEMEEKKRLLFWKEYFKMRNENHERKQLENSSN